MNPKKGMQPQPAMQPMQPSQGQAKATSTSASSSSSAQTYATGRSAAPKAVPVLTRELAATMFMITKAEKSGQAIPQVHLDKAKEITEELQKVNVEFHGLLGKCMISGHDCHYMSPALDITEHISSGSAVPEDFARARELVHTLPPQAICLLVFSHQIECLYADGSTQVLERT